MLSVPVLADPPPRGVAVTPAGGQMLHLLERRGFARRDSQTPLEFAAEVSSPELAPAVREFTQICAQARFGGVPCDTFRLRALLDQVRAALRGR